LNDIIPAAGFAFMGSFGKTLPGAKDEALPVHRPVLLNLAKSFS
jgi:hypothetical protein